MMFTGIIEEIGTISRIEPGSNSCRIEVMASKVLDDVRAGDSIAVNGVCLTVTEFDRRHFTADVMAETLLKTNLREQRNGSRVNLERALRLGDRLGGHLVQGHVDGVGMIAEQQKLDIATILRIKTEPGVLHYIVPKGSVAIDGTSLTVIDVLADSFTVSLIPHTAHMTTLGWRKTGDTVNLETDVIGRYVERLLTRQEAGTAEKLTIGFLAEHGFA